AASTFCSERCCGSIATELRRKDGYHPGRIGGWRWDGCRGAIAGPVPDKVPPGSTRGHGAEPSGRGWHEGLELLRAAVASRRHGALRRVDFAARSDHIPQSHLTI